MQQPYIGVMAPRRKPAYRAKAQSISPTPMRTEEHDLVIAVVDDEAALREALESLLRSAGFKALTFPSAEEFLASDCGKRAGCLILDVRLPGMSGPELQRHLAKSGSRIPIVFITAQEDRDGELCAQVLRQGALACLRKPFGDEDLLNAVESACAQ